MQTPPARPSAVVAPPNGRTDTTLPEGPHMGPLDLSIWRNRNFLLLWLAQAISQTA
jgi:hypothetical protein